MALLQADGNPAEDVAGTKHRGAAHSEDEEYQMSRAAVADPPEIRRKMMRALGYVTVITLTVAGIALGAMGAAVMACEEPTP